MSNYEYSPTLAAMVAPDVSSSYQYGDSLLKLLDLKKSDLKIGMSEERIEGVLDIIAQYGGYWREYPDMLVDLLIGENSTFQLYFYQRVFLRSVMRHKYSYGVFPRAYSKSFLSFMAQMLKCVLYPGSKLFIVSGTKEQAASIAKEKFEEIVELMPGLRNEVNMKKSQFAKDYVRIKFKNGSVLDVVAARNSTRGGRRHGGLMEEVNNIALIYLFPLTDGGLCAA